jgi:hypothetical protein
MTGIICFVMSRIYSKEIEGFFLGCSSMFQIYAVSTSYHFQKDVG